MIFLQIQKPKTKNQKPKTKAVRKKLWGQGKWHERRMKDSNKCSFKALHAPQIFVSAF
jgi:hypothetical protein